MPDNIDTNTRQCLRKKKNLHSTAAEDELGMKPKEFVTTKASQRQRKVVSKAKENEMVEEFEDTLEYEGPASQGNSIPGRGHPAGPIGKSNDSVFGRGFVNLSTSASTPSSSPSKKSHSPSKGLMPVNKRERMKFMDPPIEFKTLEDTIEFGYLTSKLQKLWRHMNWNERKVIPSAFKVKTLRYRLIPHHADFLVLIIEGNCESIRYA